MMTTRSRVVHVHTNGRADAEIFLDSCFEALGFVLGLVARFLVLGSRAVVAAMRGDR
jgi:hypothetical protein